MSEPSVSIPKRPEGKSLKTPDVPVDKHQVFIEDQIAPLKDAPGRLTYTGEAHKGDVTYIGTYKGLTGEYQVFRNENTGEEFMVYPEDVSTLIKIK